MKKIVVNFLFYLKHLCVFNLLLIGSCTTDDLLADADNLTTAVNATASIYPAGAVKASTFGYNSSNATDAFQKAIKSNYSTIIIDKQSGNWNIGPSTFTNISNKTIIFENGVIVKALPKKFPNNSDCLIRFRDANNIRLEGNNAILEGNKKEYLGSNGRHILNLQGCKGVNINGFTIRNSGGDGIYIGRSTNKTFSEDISISNVKSLYNTRLGIGVISAQNLNVSNSEFSNSKGSLPEAGVDFEPNYPYERLVNITFQNCRFTNNNNAGIQIGTKNLVSSSLPVSIAFKKCYLSRNGISDDKPVNSEIIISAHLKNPVRGNVLFEDMLVENSDWGLFHANKLEKAFHVTFRNIVAKNIVLKNTLAAMKIRVQDKTNTDPIGGLIFDNVYLEYEGSQPFFYAQGSTAMNGLKNITGTVTVKSSVKKTIKITSVNTSKNVNVNINHKWIPK